MAADPLKEVLLKVIKERSEQINRLTAEYRATQDPIKQAELDEQIKQLQREQMAAQGALSPQSTQQAAAPSPDTSAPPPPQSEAVQPVPEPAQPPKAPTRAALEAQIKELSTDLQDVARRVEQSGADPNPHDVKHLAQTRQRLQNALTAIGQIDPPIDPASLPPKPTPSQQAEADNLVRQSRVFKMRGQHQQASEMLRKAAEFAPGAISVLEALGDDLLERGQAKPAAETYQKALGLDPSNVGLERKYGAAIARVQGVMTVEEALNLKLGDSLSAADAATVKGAAFLSFFIPGGGQIVLGDYAKGAAYLGIWLGMILWLSLMPKGDLSDSVRAIFGGSAHLRPIVFVPLAIMLCLQLLAAFTVKGSGQNAGSLRVSKGNHPKPPVDLPYE